MTIPKQPELPEVGVGRGPTEGAGGAPRAVPGGTPRAIPGGTPRAIPGETPRAIDDPPDRAELLASVVDLQRRILGAEVTDALLGATVLAHATRLTASPRGFVATIEPGTGDLVMHAVHGAGQAPPLPPRVKVGRDGSYPGVLGDVLASQRGSFANTAQESADPARPAGHLAIERFAAVPVQAVGRAVGVIGVVNATRAYGPADLETLEELASVYALGVQRLTGERALRESKARLDLLTSRAPAGIFETDAAGRVVFVNDRWVELTGVAPGDASAAPWTEAVHPEDRARVRGAWEAAVAGGRPFESELRVHTRNGEVSWVIATAMPLGDGGYLGIATDTTEHKRMQSRLVFADRMASVGTLAAGVAHEINNPLAYIIASIDFAAEELRGKIGALSTGNHADVIEGLDDALRALRDAREGSERVRRIVRDLKTFSRPQDEQTTRVDVERILESCISMAGNEIRHRALLVRQFGGVPAVTGSDARLAQVFLNLLVNAAQAIPEGKAQSNEIRVTTRVDGRGRVVVEVEDTGCGMTPDVLAHIFDPFFTTKEVGEGTGLGLSICHSIVAAVGGEIHVQSTPDRGSCFRVLLPAAPAERVAPAPAAPTAAGSGRGRVLVVDDEPLIGVAIKRMLEGENDVQVETNARSALEAVSNGGVFDVILCDLMMPEMTGMDFFDELGRVSPETQERVIFFTGGAFTSRAREFLDKVRNPSLEKPIDMKALREVVRRMKARARLDVEEVS
jgi:PAS domain S-box-containing protein